MNCVAVSIIIANSVIKMKCHNFCQINKQTEFRCFMHRLNMIGSWFRESKHLHKHNTMNLQNN